MWIGELDWAIDQLPGATEATHQGRTIQTVDRGANTGQFLRYLTKKEDTMTRKRDPNTIEVKAKPDEEQSVSLARVVLQPSIKGAVTIKEYSPKYNGFDLDLMGLASELSDQNKAVNEGHLDRAEGMLMVQAHTLDAIFNNLAQRAINAGLIDNLDRHLRLALKAQSQCRATLETLATLKNPTSVAFVRQANIANGPQQVNNSVAEISENKPNKLLDHQHGKRMDFGTKSATGGADSTLETVGKINRPQDRNG